VATIDAMKSFRYWGPAIGFAVFIFILSSIPGKIFQEVESPLHEQLLPFSMGGHLDKVVHTFLYATLGWLWLRAFVFGKNISLPKAAFLAFAVVALFGVSDELHQLLTPDRSCDLYDWFADCFGGILSITPFSWRYQRSFRNSTNPLSSVITQ
jgi:VanZ family protein